MAAKLDKQARDDTNDGIPDSIAGCDREPWGWSNGNGNGGRNGNGNGGGNGNANGGCGNYAGNGNGNGPEIWEKDHYYYHPDHLGSTSYVTDVDGEIFQHLEYFPFGETFVEEASNTQRTPYLFTAKELDEETGLYYFGARYNDPRTSVWQSTDPILKGYMGGAPNNGVYRPINLSLYAYLYHRPLKLIDPDGRCASGTVVTSGTDAAGKAYIGCRPAGFWEAGPVRRFATEILGDSIAGVEALVTGNDQVYNRLTGMGYTPREIQDLKCLSITSVIPIGRGAQVATNGRRVAASAADEVAGLLPAPRQITAAFGANAYRHGGLMSTLEHIVYRHGANSGFEGVSRFTQGTSGIKIKGLIDDALR